MLKMYKVTRQVSFQIGLNHNTLNHKVHRITCSKINTISIIYFLLTTSYLVNTQQIDFEFDPLNTLYFKQKIPDHHKFLSKYDFVIIGGGSTGCVMANRLTERNWNVLLLEAGGEEPITSEIPLIAELNLYTSLDWGYKAKKSPNYCTGFINQTCDIRKGRSIGGTSVMNFMVYTVGNKKDFDDWESLGNPGWGYNEVLQYFKKSEDLKTPELRNSAYRGCNGPVSVEQPNYTSKLLDAFLIGGKELGYENNDPNAGKQLGFSKVQGTLKRGRRCSASKAYIRTILNRKNLFISLRSHVTKIKIDPISKTATHVEFMKDGRNHIVRAEKEVILSAGVIASPQLLMLSGVGPKDNLDQVGIPVIQNLRVSYNLQDQIGLPGIYFSLGEPVNVSPLDIVNPINAGLFLTKGKGPWTLPGGSLGLAFVKTPNSTKSPDYPDVEIVLGAGGYNYEIIGNTHRIMGYTDEYFYSLNKNILNKPAFELVTVLLRPESQGRVSLISNSPFENPVIELNYLAHPNDVKILSEGIEISIKLAETSGYKSLDTNFNAVPFYGCENFTFRSAEYWECCLRKYTISLQHHVGTCKMGPASDPDAVVDAQLKVYGINGLRVVDASIMPFIPASHTNAVAYMIGEKAADMVKQDWKGHD